MKVRITLFVEYDEMSDEARQQLADTTDQNASDLPTAADAGPDELADTIAAWLENADDEMFAGTEMYLQITGVTVGTAETV